MVLNGALYSSWKKMKVGRVVLISGLLTFLFLVEFCIGLRNLHYIFKLWHDASRIPLNKEAVSWTLCVACLLICVFSTFTVSVISAIWEQKQMAENGKEKSPIRFALHIFVSGMIWRYVKLWFAENKKLQKKEALLLTLLKFFFTQFFTIPMVIIHASSSEKLEEIIYDICSVSCISVNLILTCTVFSWCKSEVNELKKWNFETIDLIPLIFCQSSEDPQPPTATDQSNSDAKSKEVANNNPNTSCDLADDSFESALVRIIVLFQTFSFTFGRLLALGILLKLAGIYALTILFLQLLISVVYLKFQVPFLVSDSLPKWRQLLRLAFMSYILIFEWHLNRDPKTAYDFTSNIKHSMLYYFIATLESIFYFVTWAITEAYASNSSFNDNVMKRRFSRNIIIMGVLSLMFSLIVHFLLLFWHSRRLSAFINSMQRSYLKSNLKIVKKVRNKDKSKSTALEANKQYPEISDPIPLYDSSDGCHPQKDVHSPLEKRNSYKDLREPIDDEIEIYARKNSATTVGKKTKASPITERELYSKRESTTSCTEENHKQDMKKRSKGTKLNSKITSTKSNSACESKDSCITVISRNDSNSSQSESDTKSNENATESKISPASRTKRAQFSESINDQWSKFSSIPKKLTGTMRDQIQKRKEQFHNFRNSSSEKATDIHQQNAEEHCSPEKNSKVYRASIASQSKEEISVNESSEAYFMGDSQDNEYKQYDSGEEVGSSDDNTDIYDTNEEMRRNSTISKEDSASIASQSKKDSVANQTSEAYFIGDHQGYEDNQCDSGEVGSSDDNSDIDDTHQEVHRNSTMEDTSDEMSQQEQSHMDGEDPCPCNVCIPKEGGILRRRSSSVPTVDKLPPLQHFLSNMIEDELPERSSMVRYPSSPSVVRVDMKPSMNSDYNVETMDTCSPSNMYLKGRSQNLSVFALDNRVEQYV